MLKVCSLFLFRKLDCHDQHKLYSVNINHKTHDNHVLLIDVLQHSQSQYSSISGGSWLYIHIYPLSASCVEICILFFDPVKWCIKATTHWG